MLIPNIALGHSQHLNPLKKNINLELFLHLWIQNSFSAICEKQLIYRRDLFDLAMLNSMTSSCFSFVEVWKFDPGEQGMVRVHFDLPCLMTSALGLGVSGEAGEEQATKFTFLCM